MASNLVNLQDDSEPQKLNRRCIYLHRLVGDDIRAPRTKSSRRTSWRVVLRFLVYAVIAIFTIKERSNVWDLSAVNTGLNKAMNHRWYTREPTVEYFDDIKDLEDLKSWARIAFLNQVSVNDSLSRPVSLLAYNRVTSMCGLCPKTGGITITLRRVASDRNHAQTTTRRFRQLYPDTWKSAAIRADGETTESEATDTMRLRRNSSITWPYTPKCDCQCQGGQHDGYMSNGGYVAVLTVTEDSAKQYVHLVDNTQPVSVDPAMGICEGVRKSATIEFQEFLDAGFLDTQFSSLTFEFMVYNANMQVMSNVVVTFQGSEVGVVVQKDIVTKSVKLDIYNTPMRYFEIMYLVCTSCYFFEFSYRAYKYYPTFLYDIWTYVNLMSIVMSLTSLALWFMYIPMVQDFLSTNSFLQPQKFFQLYRLNLGFLRCGALATLTICLRILKFMGDLISRVRLLTRTIAIAAKKVSIYVSYVLVIFLGFTAYSYIKFSATNASFVTPTAAFMACFGLLLGDSKPFKRSKVTQQDVLTVGFYVLFMVFFFFVSVQMFNAIINYAYNMVSEQMEPEFEQENRERRRNQLQQWSACKHLLSNLGDNLCALCCKKKGAETAKDSAGEAEQKKEKKGRDAIEGKDRVEHKSHAEKRKMPDSVCRMIIFMMFAICYMWFLLVNLNVDRAYAVKRSISNAVWRTSIMEFSVPGTATELSWDQIVSLSHVSSWVYGSLPRIIFNSTSWSSTESALDDEIHREGAVCIHSWNCLITGDPLEVDSALANAYAGNTVNSSESLQAEPTPVPGAEKRWPPRLVPTPLFRPRRQNRALVRITQRRVMVMRNSGCASNSTPTDQCFTGGLVGNLSQFGLPPERNYATAMSPTRYPDKPLFPGTGKHDWEDRWVGYEVKEQDRTICKTTTDGGYEQLGGIVCLLDADYNTFLTQLGRMEETNFISDGTASLAIDFATYNGNKNTLTYTLIEFALLPSGGVWKRIRVSSMALMDFNYFLDTYHHILIRIMPGILYMILVCKFTVDLNLDLRQEIYKKRINENSSWLVASVEFFTLDVFNLLEAVSIWISFISFVLYLLWLVAEGNLGSMLVGDLNLVLDSALNLSNQARLYNRLSAMNCLLILTRPLKFVRQSVRFAQLYQTLWDAFSDIMWFVFMFAVTMLGCVMYAHVSFGPSFEKCRSMSATMNFLFNYVRGNFDWFALEHADPVMARFFFVPYLLVFSLVFLNIFFAIIDRYYTPQEAPPLNIKRRLKPVFQRICRCIEWDEDYVMEQDNNEEKKNLGPPSRQRKVHDLVQTIKHTMNEHDHSSQLKSSKILSDVCDTDERMGEVLHWGRDEANIFVVDFQRHLQKKQTVKNDEVYIKSEVMKQVREASKVVREDMEESERLMRYATKVHEQMAMRDQETLARYILILELKIRNRMKQRHELEREVRHLRTESDKMRFTPEELQIQNGTLQAEHVAAAQRIWQEQHGECEDSDEEPAEPVASIPPPPGAEGSVILEVNGSAASLKPGSPALSLVI